MPRNENPKPLLGHDASGALTCQIDVDERQLREAIKTVPPGTDAEFTVSISENRRLRLAALAPLNTER